MTEIKTVRRCVCLLACLSGLLLHNKLLPAVGAFSESTVPNRILRGSWRSRSGTFTPLLQKPKISPRLHHCRVRRLDKYSVHCCFPLPCPDAGGSNQETASWLDGGRVYSAAGWENQTSLNVCGRGRQAEVEIVCLLHVILQQCSDHLNNDTTSKHSKPFPEGTLP